MATDEEFKRLLKAIMCITDRHCESKSGSGVLEIPVAPHELKELRSSFEPFRKELSEPIKKKDWRVVVDDTGGPNTGWPSVWSDSEDRAVIHDEGFHQEFWQGPTLKEAFEIAHVVAKFMNERE